MYRQQLKLPFAFLLATGVGLSACGGATPPSAPGDAAADATAASAIEVQQPSSVASVSSAAASAIASAVPGPRTTAEPAATGGADAKATNASRKSAIPAALPRLVVTKTPTCGCCHLWVEHMQNAGFQVEVHDVEDMGPAKARVGVPYGKGSCHTAEVGDYFVEGHVPAEDVKRLLAEKPDAKGLTLPGMPLGSPGMETPDGRVQPYVVELVAKDGTTSPFARHGH